MTPFLQLVFAIAVILLTAKLAGYLSIRRMQALREDLPLMPTLEDFFARVENLSHITFSTVENGSLVEAIVAAIEQVVGDLRKPDTGILVVLPMLRAYGSDKER